MVLYENVIIFHPDLSEERVDEFLKKVSGLIQNGSGEMLSQEKLGRKRMAYPVKKQREGNYVIQQFKAAPSAVLNVRNVLQLEQGIIRSLIFKKEIHKQRPPKKSPEPPKEAAHGEHTVAGPQ